MRLAILVSAVLLSGCAPLQVTLMPRDSGQTAVGEIQGRGGRGTMTVHLGDATCTGPIARVASNEVTVVGNSFGTNSAGQFGSRFSSATASGDSFAKAILSCSNGSGLRCDLSGRGGSAGGVCTDDKGRVYDALATRR